MVEPAPLVLAWAREGAELRATLSRPGGGPVAGTVPASRLAALPAGWLASLRKRPREEQRQAGERFTREVLPPEIARGLAEAVNAASAPLGLEIRGDDVELLHLPWELLATAEHGILVASGRAEVYRRLSGTDVSSSPPAETLRVIGLTPSPLGDQHARPAIGNAGFVEPMVFWEQEQERLLSAMEPLLRSGRGRLALPDEGTLEQLSLAVSSRDRPEVLHLACHGGFRDGPVVQLEDDAGNARYVSPGEIGATLAAARATLALVVLGACESALALAGDTLEPSFAAALLGLGVERALGYQARISDAGATAFAAAFYQRLALGDDLVAALRAGRAALAEAGAPGEYLLPALFVRSDAGPLVAESPATSGAEALQVWRGAFAVDGVSYLDQGYVGRRHLEREIARDWRAGRRVLVLHGLGGIGKSTMACRFLERRKAEGWRAFALYAGRRLSAADVRADLARHLGVEAPAAAAIADADEIERQWEERLGAALTSRRETCYLLDNFEDHHGRDGRLHDPALGEMLAGLVALGQGRLRLLITTRHPLQPFGVPEQLGQHALGELSGASCRKLKALDPHGLGRLSAELWQEALALVGGHPKALQLLGAFLRRQPAGADDLLQRLAEGVAEVDLSLAVERQERGRRLLVGELVADLPSRHRASFDRLCMLEVPVARVDLEELLAAEGCTGIAETLDWLQDRGLLAMALGEAGLGLQVHRMVARHHLAASALVLSGWHLRLADFFFRRWTDVLANFGVAAVHADAAGQRTLALAYYRGWAIALRRDFYFRAAEDIARQGLARLPPREASERVMAASLWQEVFEAAESLGRHEDQVAALERAETLVEDAPDEAVAHEVRGNLWFCRGRLEHHRGQPELAEKAYENAVTAYRRAGAERGEALAAGALAEVWQGRGQYDRALEMLRALVLPSLERLGDQRERAVALGKVAEIHRVRGRYDEALALLKDEMLPTYRQLGEKRETAVTLEKIAQIRFLRGEYDRALGLWRDYVLPAFDELGDVYARAATLGKIADVHQHRGELDEALRIRREEELPVYERLQDLRAHTVAMGRIADLHQLRRQFDDALRLRREQLPIYEQLGDIRSLVLVWSKIADIHHARGELDEALAIWRERELPVLEKLGDPRNRSITLGRIADVLQERGDLEGARRLQIERLGINQSLEDPAGIAATSYRLATLDLAMGDRSAAEPRFREAWQFFEALGDPKGIAWVGTDWGHFLAQAGRTQEARTIWTRTIAAWRQLGLDTQAQLVEQMLAALS